MEIPNNLKVDIQSYCEANALDFDKYVIQALTQGHTILKYGMRPNEKPELIPTIPKADKIIAEPVVTTLNATHPNTAAPALITPNDIYDEQ